MAPAAGACPPGYISTRHRPAAGAVILLERLPDGARGESVNVFDLPRQDIDGLLLVGYHPHFIMASGMPTHYDSPSGEPVAIETHVHLLSEHVGAGLAAGWSLLEFHERVADETWLALKPKWRRFKGHPVSFALAWRLA